MAKIVHHYYPKNSTNVGDTLVAYAIQRALPLFFGDLEFIHLPVNDRFKSNAPDEETGLLERNIHRSNSEADLIVIGGSNLLEPRKISRNKTPWHWGIQTSVESLQRIQVPLLLIGMGTGSDWGCPIKPYSDQARGEVQLLHRLAFASAVRDEPTRQRLADISVKTHCTGCPVTFLTDRPIEYFSGSKPLLVSLPPARILKRWSGRWFMYQTMNYIRWLHQQAIPFVVTLHERADQNFAPSWLPSGVSSFYTENVSELISRYEDSCGVVGFRLHAALLGLGLGKPIIPVNVDWRGRAFSQTYDLNAIALEPGKWRQFSRLKRLTRQLLDGDAVLYSKLNLEKLRYLNKYRAFLASAAHSYSQVRRNVNHLVA